ncbi:MAG: exodeoxyribonuclease III [Deltaproteobacteria bacterium]|nr:exodeoxyribonuclease III [Deltaproteobacteria bacterium]
MKIATFNANSIRARLPIIGEWLEREHPDILCLQETKVQDKDFPQDMFTQKGYQVVINGQKSYNGVAIASRLPMGDITYSLYGSKDGEEARFISARVKDLEIINVYVPQGYAVGTEKFRYKLLWLRDLLEYVKGAYLPDDMLFLAGDFNVALEPTDVYDPEKFDGEVCFHPEERAILREYLGWGFVDLFRVYEKGGGKYTFWDYRIPNAVKRNMGWRLDYIFVTEPLAKRSTRAWVDLEPRLKERPSDHTFLVAEFNNL